MNAPPQAIYHVSRDGKLIGSFTAEQLSSGLTERRLWGTDHYRCEGRAEWRLLEDLFPTIKRTTSNRGRTELRHVGIALVMLLGIAAVGLGVFAIIRVNSHTPESAPTEEAHPLSAEPSGVDHQIDIEERYQKAFRQWAGDGVEKDTTEGTRVFKELANKGHAGAQFSLGKSYATGEGISKDVAKAVEWYGKAAAQGYTNAQHNLGVLYRNGKEIPKDAAKAAEWFTKAAALGNASSQFALGLHYQTSEGIPKDAAKAIEWFSKAAEQGDARAQHTLGICYINAEGVPKDAAKAVEWFAKAADQGMADAQFEMGKIYLYGDGGAKDGAKALEWFSKAAAQDYLKANFIIGTMYFQGDGVPKDAVKAMEWYRKAADRGFTGAQLVLGLAYAAGAGIPKDAIQAHYWLNLAAAADQPEAREALGSIEEKMTPSQIAEAERLASEFKPRKAIAESVKATSKMIDDSRPTGHGTGFFISSDGYFATNHHIVKGASQVRINTGSGIKVARVIRMDEANDLALLKVDGTFSALPIASSRAIALGNTVTTVGFPNIELMGFSPKLAKGDIASLAGMQDDPRYFQISVPLQPGNSGGALVDGAGNVVGVVSAKLSARAALAATGSLPENVNYAVKSSFVLSFLESVPELTGKLPDPHSGERKFEDVVKDAQQASVLVLVY